MYAELQQENPNSAEGTGRNRAAWLHSFSSPLLARANIAAGSSHSRAELTSLVIASDQSQALSLQDVLLCAWATKDGKEGITFVPSDWNFNSRPWQLHLNESCISLAHQQINNLFTVSECVLGEAWCLIDSGRTNAEIAVGSISVAFMANRFVAKLILRDRVNVAFRKWQTFKTKL